MSQLVNYINKIIAYIIEFTSMVYYGILYSKGLTDTFRFHNLNPSEIDTSKTSILYIHGYLHNQSSILPLIKKLKTDKPIFTVNLTYDYNNPAPHKAALLKRIEEIKALYHGKPCKLILIGHSQGAIEAVDFALAQYEDIEIVKVISLAGRLKSTACSSPRILSQLKRIEEGLKTKRFPLYRLSPSHDWLVPMIATGGLNIIPYTSHLSILVSDKTAQVLNQLIN